MEIKRLDHHGLVAGAIDELGLVKKIDQAIPKTKRHKVSVGEAVKAMILIGLGYTDRPLYLVAETLKNMSVEKLFKPETKPEDFTDDVLGRSLDKIYEADPTGLFIKLVNQMKPVITQGERQRLHFDTTTFSVFGEYDRALSPRLQEEQANENTGIITIEHGYPKNKRFDLKQFILSLCTNQEGLPLLMESISGSQSDKKTIVETMTKLRDNINLEKDPLYIADSAFYTRKNVKAMGRDNKFLTRAPGTLKVIKALEQGEHTFEQSPNPNYRYCEKDGEYAAIPVKYIVVHSKELQETKEKSIERRLKKEKGKAAKSFKKVCQQTYYCEADAIERLKKWEKDNKLFRVTDIVCMPQTIKKNPKRGRPSKTEATRTVYHIEATLAYDPEAVKQYTHNLGRFVLVTNDTDMSAEEALTHYKEQSRVERGFRFLKDNTFRISQVLLKKTERIQALLMVMVLTLFVYNYLERELRHRIKAKNETVENHIKKRITNPTMKMVIFQFNGIHTIRVPADKGTQVQVEALNQKQNHILYILGEFYQRIYA